MKIQFRQILIVLMAAILPVVTIVYQAHSAGPKVSEIGNKHNLSGLNTSFDVKYKATNDPINNPRGQEICIFCHTPHNANVEGGAPLWNRRFSGETFSRYSSSTLQIRTNLSASTQSQFTPTWQPNGSSKLCLSCHDGVDTSDHRLGDVLRGGPIAMNPAGGDFISSNTAISFASFNPLTNKMKTGHHPVSFVYNAAVRDAIQATKIPATVFTFPPTETQVKLDKQSRMQCTTCHDAHQNMSNDTDFYASPNDTRKVAPFWVYGVNNSGSADQQAVCISCHPMTITATPKWP